jgi:hypothetical protein
MSGFEIAGIALAAPAIVQQLVKVSLEGYKVFQGVKDVGMDFQKLLHALGVIQAQLEDWDKKLSELGGFVLGIKSRRYQLILETLALMAGVFVEVDQLERRYGIRRSNAHTLPDRTQSVENYQSPQMERSPRKWLNLSLPHLRRSRSRSRDSRSGDLIHLGSAAQSSPDLSGPEKLSSSRTELMGTNLKRYLSNPTESDLEVQLVGLDDCTRQIEVKVQEYQRTLSTFRKYEWVFSSHDKLKLLVEDLKYYMDCLDKLTLDFFQSMLKFHLRASAVCSNIRSR